MKKDTVWSLVGSAVWDGAAMLTEYTQVLLSSSTSSSLLLLYS